MKPPHNLADLPFAADLRVFDGVLELDGDYDRVRFSGSAFPAWSRAGPGSLNRRSPG